MPTETEKFLIKKARHGWRGGPIASIALYGPDDKRATVLALAMLAHKDDEPREMRRWVSDGDVRNDPDVLKELKLFFLDNPVKTVVFPNLMVGCPHEKGRDYTEDYCPTCTYWRGRDRLSAVRSWRGSGSE